MFYKLIDRISKHILNYNLSVEIINEGDSSNRRIINSIINEFFSRNQRKLITNKNFKIIIPRDFNATYYYYSNSSIKEFIDKNGYSEYLALLILPSDTNSKEFTLIIRNDIMSIKNELYKTLFHEFTHIIDYTNFFNHKGNLYISDINTKIDNYYFEFYLWTEFHAKKVGLKRYKKCGGTTNLVEKADDFERSINQTTTELGLYYSLMHFLARISVFKHFGLSSNEFPVKHLSLFLEIDVLKLYKKLNKIETYKDFNNEKKLLRELLCLKDQENYLC